jgi:hypothetical protein
MVSDLNKLKTSIWVFCLEKLTVFPERASARDSRRVFNRALKLLHNMCLHTFDCSFQPLFRVLALLLRNIAYQETVQGTVKLKRWQTEDVDMKRMLAVLGAVGTCLLAISASANTITFSTAPGATESGGNPVNASATFTTGAGTVVVTLDNLLANPTTVAQLISDFSFGLSSGQTSGTLSSSSGIQRFVFPDGMWTAGATVSTGWGVDAGTLHVTALGFGGPAGLIIGPPGGANTYANANASIAGNGPHNPFMGLSATFNLSVPGVTADSIVNNVLFSFGTTAGNDVPGVPGGNPGPTVPDGGTTVLLLGIALSGLGLIRRKLS